MSNIFFDLNGYDTRQISFILDYLINIQADKLYLLRENHTGDELWISEISPRVCIVENFENSIHDGDIVFTSDSRKYRKLSDKIHIINFSQPETFSYKKPSYRCFSQIVPTILIVSMGDFVNALCLELLIKKVLDSNNITSQQKFSPETSFLLKCLKKTPAILNLSEPELSDKPQMNVVYIDAHQYKSVINFMYEVKKLNPGLIFVCVNQNFNDYRIINYFRELLCSNCIIVQSPYITYETGTGKTIPIYCETNSNNDGLKYNNSLESTIKQKIFDSFYIPKEVSIIK